jgi:adenylate cyclase
MPDLIAQGPKPENRWRRKIAPGQSVLVGRSAGRLSVTWDDRISRKHVELVFSNNKLNVKRMTEALNPVFFQGTERDQFELEFDGHFVIGSTAFTFVNDHVTLTLDAPLPVAEETISYEALQQLRFHDADRRIDILSRLPELLSTATSDHEQAEIFVSILLAGIPAATFVALVAIDGPDGEIAIRHWDHSGRDSKTVLPSERLIRQAASSNASVIHVWQSAAAPQSNSAGGDSRFTQIEGADWAFCAPIDDENSSGYAIYVAGERQPSGPDSAATLLQEEVKFVDLAARTLFHVRGIRRFERERASLRQFISPVVMETLADEDPEVVLTPREVEASVLFCDLRGFSRRSEQEADNLMELLNRVSRALGVMTHEILGHGGVVGDFHGDAAMGFWGWPLDQADAPLQACRAALQIRDEFVRAAQDPDHPLSDFRMGIGIASGNAVAGKIGTVDQVKVTVFGPVVNLASRLEDMTKTLRAPILMDETTANRVRAELPANAARVRRVARVRPEGMATAVEVSELLPPVAAFSEMPDEGIAAYERALDSLLAGDWDQAFSLLHRVPAEDRVKDFLTVFIAQNNRTPPPDWDGVIPLAHRT